MMSEAMFWLVVTEFVMAALMLPWSVAYFLFPTPVAMMVGQSDEARQSPLGQNLLAIARFVRQCAISHVVMGVAALAMGFAMLRIGEQLVWVAIRVVLPMQLLYGGIYSMVVVGRFRKDAGLSAFRLSDLVDGIKGGF